MILTKLRDESFDVIFNLDVMIRFRQHTISRCGTRKNCSNARDNSNSHRRHAAKSTLSTLQRSVRRHAVSLCLSRRTLARILFSDLKLHPYKQHELACQITRFIHVIVSVYGSHPQHTINEPKARIRNKTASISVQMLRRVKLKLHSRLQECVRREGRHLQDVILKKRLLYLMTLF
ncbi:hypothetical protein C0J52_09280 [Blattella germanica]|nr:hypothetical protein C0J52_09280 [Blattella germanica]